MKAANVLDPSEAEVQASIVAGLRWLGYTVLVTTRHCGRPDGADKGLADLMITRRSWPPFVWLAIEVKGPKTRLSLDQVALFDANRIAVVRDFDAARGAVEAFERSLKEPG